MPKRTLQPKKRKYSKVHGYRKRMRTPGGRNVLKSRTLKGRKRISVKRLGSGKGKKR